MARSRLMKPGFFANETLCELDPFARILFAGLWTLADREGRVEDRPKRIKAMIFPYDSCDVDALLTALHEAQFILRYEVAGDRYISIPTWHKHQQPHRREAASVIPGPPKAVQGQTKDRPRTVQGQSRDRTGTGQGQDATSGDDEFCQSNEYNEIEKDSTSPEKDRPGPEKDRTSPAVYLNPIPVYLNPIPRSLDPEVAPPPDDAPLNSEFDYVTGFGEVWSAYPRQGRTKQSFAQAMYVEALRKKPDPAAEHAKALRSILPGGIWAESQLWKDGYICSLAEFCKETRWNEDPVPAGSGPARNGTRKTAGQEVFEEACRIARAKN